MYATIISAVVAGSAEKEKKVVIEISVKSLFSKAMGTN